jgi:preprotein translocase subunit YajC
MSIQSKGLHLGQIVLTIPLLAAVGGWVLGQDNPTSGGGSTPDAAGEPAGGAGPAGGAQSGFAEFLFGNPLGFMMLAMLLLYIIVIMPQQRQARHQQRELAGALKNLKKNDRIVTLGGIHGTVVHATPEAPTISVRIDDSTNTKMTISREAVARVVKEETKADQ